MKNVSIAIGLLSALLFANAGRAENIGITWADAVGAGKGWLPKIASDGSNGVTTLIDQEATGMATFAYENGQFTPSISLLSWDSTNNIYSASQPNYEVGHDPSIAMVTCYASACMGGPYYTANVVQVHQGGQDGGAELWYRTGVVGIDPTGKTTWGAAQSYDTGFNPTVAVNQYSTTPGSTTVVEVHQAGVNSSALWFHIGTLTYSASSVAVTWGSALPTGLTGYAPSVSYSNGVAVLVAQGPSGELWYSIGTWSTGGAFIWGPATSYTTGYNPSVSLQYCPGGVAFNCVFLLVEAHQETNSTGTLYYRTGILTGVDGTSTTITWTPNKDRKIGSFAFSGCYPTVSLITNWSAGYYNVVESHSAKCGEPANLTTWWGTLSLE
jgi:hypothetical protein